MQHWLKRVSGVAIGCALLVAGLALVSWLRYGPVSLFGHAGIRITLPYQVQDEPTGMMPLGEREAVHPAGHPGIDFQWGYAAPLIAAFDGTITRIVHDTDSNEPILIVTLRNGEYTSIYNELESVASGIREGSHVSQGDIVGYPHGHSFSDSGGHTNYQVHWEFGYASFPGSTRLCPLTYLTPEDLVRINALWDKTKPNHPNPTGQLICNGEYAGKDE